MKVFQIILLVWNVWKHGGVFVLGQVKSYFTGELMEVGKCDATV